MEDAAPMMSEHQIQRLPIVGGNHRLVGMYPWGDFAVDSSDVEPANR